MAEHIPSPEERAAVALAEYRGNGPEVFPATIAAGKFEEWIQQCEGATLTGQQMLDMGWLLTEYGVALSSKNRDRAVALFDQAQENFAKATEAENPPRVTAQALLAYGGLPVLRLRIGVDGTLEKRRTYPGATTASKSDSNRMVASRQWYWEKEKEATEHVRQLLQHDNASVDDIAFSNTFAVTLLVNNLQLSRFFILPMPPRCYEGLPNAAHGYSATLWDTRKAQSRELCIAENGVSSEYILAISPQILTAAEDGGNSDLQEQEVLCQLLGPAESNPQPSLHTADIVAVQRQLINQILTACGSTAQERTLLKQRLLIAAKNAAPPVSKRIEVQEALPAAPIEMTGISAENIFSWYAQQTNGRLLTPAEAQKIDKIIFTFDAKKKLESLSASELLALNRLRLECALGLPKEQRKLITSYLHDANNSLRTMQEQAQLSGDTQLLFEAALDQSMLPFYRILSLGGDLTRDNVMENYAAIAEILGETLWERKQKPKTEEEKARIASAVTPLKLLVPPALNAIILGVYTGGEYLALPSLPRQKGSAEIPGWDMNVWRKNTTGNYTISQLHKLRFSSEGNTLSLHGDVAVVPYSMIDQALNPDGLLAGLIARLQDDTGAKEAKRFKRKAPDIKKVLIQATELTQPRA